MEYYRDRGQAGETTCDKHNLGFSVWLPNNQPSFITLRVLRASVNIQGVNTEADFEVWDGARYEVILGMTWLKEVDAWIACQEGEVHGKLLNGKFFSIRGKRSLPNTPIL